MFKHIFLAIVIFSLCDLICCENELVQNGICLTPGCITAAANVLNNMNITIDPCDNFYQFACGKYIQEAIIPDDKDSLQSFDLISDNVMKKLRNIIETPPKQRETTSFNFLRKLYKTCIDKKQIENTGTEMLKTILKNLGGWPVLQDTNFNENLFDWKVLIYNLRKLGYNTDSIIKLDVQVDAKNSTRRLITLDQAKLGLQKEVFGKGRDDEVVKAYYNYMVSVATFLGANKTLAAVDLTNSFEFEMELAKISLPSEKWFNATLRYNPSTVKELQKNYPSLPWMEYINNVLSIPDVKVTEDEQIVVAIPQYIKDLEDLLERTPKRTIANYIMWRVIDFSVPYLAEGLMNIKFKLESVQKGIKKKQDQGTKCIKDVLEKMPLAMGNMYVRNFFSESSRNNVKQIVSDLKRAFKSLLEDAAWMDETTKRNALEKLAKVTTYVGYADEILNDQELEKYYLKLEFNSDNYLMTILNITRFNKDKSFGALRQLVNKTEWSTRFSPIIVNARYSETENGIQVPAGILQGVFFRNDRPQYMNYGGIGYVVGHEITHGFDQHGRLFDKDGNLVNWWTENTNKAYQSKTQCIIDQYSNYSVPELNLHLNGIATANENIADNGGILEAYKAYNIWTKNYGIEPYLPGLNYTPNQMFWISAANLYCAKYRPKEVEFEVLTNPHSPLEFRILGPFSNSEAFSKDFNCPLGSKMNPAHKCDFW